MWSSGNDHVVALSRSSQVLTWGCAEQGARPYSCACSCAALRLSATPPRTYLCQRAYKLAKTPAHSRKTRAHSPGALAPAPLPFGPYFPRVCVCACVRAVCGLLFVCSCGCDANRAARADTQGGLRRQEQEGRYRVEEQPPYSQRRALVRSFLIQPAASERSFLFRLLVFCSFLFRLLVFPHTPSASCRERAGSCIFLQPRSAAYWERRRVQFQKRQQIKAHTHTHTGCNRRSCWGRACRVKCARASASERLLIESDKGASLACERAG